jgi:hypothetical protein
MTPASTRRAGRLYRYYRCITRDKEGAEACPTQPMPAAETETFVVSQIRTATSSGRLADDVAAQLSERIAQGRSALGEERRTLPPAIARLAAEGRKLTETAGGMEGAARRLVEDRLRQLGEELGRKEARLAEVERQFAVLRDLEVEGAWVERALRDFDTLWEELTPENRVRLVRAVVAEVVVDQPGERMDVRLADLSGAVPATGPVVAEGEAGGPEPPPPAAEPPPAPPGPATGPLAGSRRRTPRGEVRRDAEAGNPARAP